MLGYDPDEFARDYKSWKAMVHPNDVKRLKQHQADHFAGRTEFSIELRMKEKSGNWHWIHSRGLLLERGSRGKPLRMVGTHSDIQPHKRAEQERKRLQAQLAHAQKLECVGRLAGGIAHDFSNLMSVILLQADAAREALSGNDAVSESVTAIQESAQKAVALTRQLLAFGRKHEKKSEFLDLNSALTGCEKLVRPLIGEDIDLVVHRGQDLPLVEVDPGQLYQIVMNFAVNARDAMPHGGILTIETAAVDASAAAWIPDAKPGPYVSLTVSDNGSGMDTETQSRVFEPFFTTKEVGRGTGLGLSIVHAIVTENGGHITVHSEPGHGTEFRVYFPAALAGRAPVAQATLAPIFRGSETILLVEDEEILRNTLGKILRHAGYRVLVAADGDQAIEMDLQTGPPAQMLLTDIVMPGLSGPELARYLLGLHPDTKVLYMSGYPEAAAGIPLLSRGNFMQKPFTAVQLLRRIREVLDGCASASVRRHSQSRQAAADLHAQSGFGPRS
jgi:PAS domain S-box-containing protein